MDKENCEEMMRNTNIVKKYKDERVLTTKHRVKVNKVLKNL